MSEPMPSNRDDRVIDGFGHEWSTFDQSGVTDDERQAVFDQYFALFPWQELPASAVGVDVGCGSGRWAAVVAPRVGHLHCLDPAAEALVVARRAVEVGNATFHEADVSAMPFADASLDFGYSLGVLHHVPDTRAALSSCARVLKPGAPFLVYLYYAFDDQPAWFKALWRLSDLLRRIICRLPHGARLAVSGAIALAVYLPLARAARLLERLGRDVSSFPLSFYRQRSLYIMRNDALDRFGTRLEQRFTRDQIRSMLHDAGFVDVAFSPSPPYWTALARRA
jgi:SAM-dependent methyltransferase